MSITEYEEISLISDTRNRLGFFVISKGKLLWLGASLGAMTLYEGKGTQNVQLAFFRDDLTNFSTVSTGRFPMFL